MLDEKKKITKEEKIDAEDFARELKKLSESEKTKIYYMIKGYQLLANDGRPAKAVI